MSSEGTSAVPGDILAFDLNDLEKCYEQIGEKKDMLHEIRMGWELFEKFRLETTTEKPTAPPFGIRVLVDLRLSPDEWYMVYRDCDGRFYAQTADGEKIYLPTEDEAKNV